VKQLGLGVVGAGACCAIPGRAKAAPQTRQVLVMSDIHIGREADGADGRVWLERGFDDMEKSRERVDYGMTLGDITHNGDRASLEAYLTLRDKSPVPRWFELAGNHEYHHDGIRYYKELVGETKPYCFVDGNVAWFFVSDERRRASGNVTDESLRWLRRHIEAHRDKIIIVCSHQLPPNTVRGSDRDVLCLHPKHKIEEMVSNLPIALWLCGHEHHRPYSPAKFTEESGTTVINVASLSHAYRTHSSGSLILELGEDRREIVARRRNHDVGRYQDEFELKIKVARPIRLSR
jgi:predicted phosphodiesterase